MTEKYRYWIVLLLGFIIYGNTLFHNYALDDAIVITDNEYTLNGFNGIKDIFSEDLFNGFFEQKNKSLVAGGRYRPLSLVSFAIEWELIMGTPFDGLNQTDLKQKLDKSAKAGYILPSNKLLKDLSKTIHTDERNLRNTQQELILKNVPELSNSEKDTILSNLQQMRKNRNKLLFVSHFINVLLFCLTCVVLLKLMEIFFQSSVHSKWYLSLPFLITLIFLVHPIHTEVVANIKGRDEILSLLGSLLSLLYIIRYLQKSNIYYLVFGFLSFLAALFSKEIAVTFIVIIPLSIWFFYKQKWNAKSLGIILVHLLVAAFIYFFVRSRVLGGINFEPSTELMNNSFLGMAIGQKYATIFYTLLLYLKLLIFPHPLTYDYYPYHIPVMSWSQFWPIVSFMVYLFLGIYALVRLKKRDPVSYGILFYLVALSPTSNILFPIGVFMNERFVYAASLGMIIIITYLLVEKLKLQKLSVTIIAVLVLLYSLKTVSRNAVWKNDFTLFTNDVLISENSAKSNTSAGGKLIEEALKPGNQTKRQDYLSKAIKYLNRAITIYPSYKDALLLMGNAQWEMYQKLDSTFKYYKRILDLNPDFNDVYDNIFESKIVKTFETPENAKSNAEILLQLLKYKPDNYKANYYLGRVYGRYLHDLDKSIFYFERALQIDSGKVVLFKDLGVVYGISRQYKKSAEAFGKAFEMDNKDPVLALNLAMTYANLHERQKSIEIMDRILKMNIKKENVHILLQLASMYNNFGDKAKSAECINKAKELNPEMFKND